MLFQNGQDALDRRRGWIARQNETIKNMGVRVERIIIFNEVLCGHANMTTRNQFVFQKSRVWLLTSSIGAMFFITVSKFWWVTVKRYINFCHGLKGIQPSNKPPIRLPSDPTDPFNESVTAPNVPESDLTVPCWFSTARYQ